ncbi:alkane 1-monooxygenase [Cucumibacter marinus]|uniref:alkane 1-monooxygenase n=1 Tax=Cucumibacter marinus TaxID=1121252 RepID=UPI0009DBAED4|nr:alkane 1-monooxygenase [Cucumibacter marinus]
MSSTTTSPDRKPLLARRAFNTVRYSTMNLFFIFSTIAMAVGGGWMWFTVATAYFFGGMVEEWVGDAGNREDLPPAWYLNLQLLLTLPLSVLMTVVCLNTVTDGFWFIDTVLYAIGFDPAAARVATGFWSTLGGIMGLGVLYGMGGVIVAHELVHRTGQTLDYLMGRWLLAFTWDTGFAIEHVYGHHKHVATEQDPATAKRGEYIGVFVFRSTWGQILSAYGFERARLERRGKKDLFFNNRFWRGQLMTLGTIALFVIFAGPIGILWAFLAAFIGKFYLETVNYIEHYGLVRVPGTRVEPRHSWDSHRRVSTGMFYNLPLHSNHHTFATKPYWELEQNGGKAPMLPLGYVPMIILAFFPEVWAVLSKAMLQEWDEKLASEGERELLKERGQLLR